MRSIRRAAIVGATAASLILGATSVAVADENTNDTAQTQQDQHKDGSAEGSSFGSSDKKKDDDKKADAEAGEDQASTRKGEDHCKAEGASISSCIGDKLDADEPANGRRLFGSTQEVDKEPKWAQLMKAVTVIGLLGSFAGLVVFPAYNFAVANHLLPGMPPLPR